VATLTRVRRLVNPGRKKRKLSALQKLFFGSKRQRAAVARNGGKRKRAIKHISESLGKQYGDNRKMRKAPKNSLKYFHYLGTHKARVERKLRRKNVGSIITVWPKGHSNPGRVKRYRRRKTNRGKKVVIINKGAEMATRRRRRVSRRRKANPVARRRVRRYRRRRNYGTRVGRSWSSYARKGRKRNPGVRHHRRRHVIRNRRHYRRNPGMLTGTAGRVLGVVGGVAVTKLLCGFLPASLATGVLGYLSTGAIAVLQGKLVGKFSKSPSLGNDMLVGGLAYLAAKVLNDFFPSIGSYTGISGMGLIGGSSFYTPQVNLNGQMGNFVVPASTMGAISAFQPIQTSKGVGAMRRTGRLM
jgi:hypothetical protein